MMAIKWINLLVVVAVAIGTAASGQRLIYRWRETFDQLFFSGRTGLRLEHVTGPNTSPVTLKKFYEDTLKSNQVVKQLMDKLQIMMIGTDPSSGIPDDELKFADETLREIRDRETCKLDSADRMVAIRKSLLNHKRRKEIYGTNPPVGLLLDQYLDFTIERQLNACVDRLLKLRRQVALKVLARSLDRIDRVYRVDSNRTASEFDKRHMLLDEIESTLRNECPKRSLVNVLTLVKKKDMLKRCFDRYYVQSCKDMVELPENEITRPGEPSLESIIKAYRGAHLASNQYVTFFLDRRDTCLSRNYANLFEIVYRQYSDQQVSKRQAKRQAKRLAKQKSKQNSNSKSVFSYLKFSRD